MNVKHLAATAAVIALVPAPALSADSNVQMFGIADAYVGFQDDDRASSGDGGIVVNSGGQSQSRWGIKGSESLGEDLSAIFRFEGAILGDVGSGLSSGGGFDIRRRSFVGIQGRFGQVTLGRNYTPLFWGVIDNDVARLGHDVNDGNLGQANRVDNGVHYERKFGAATLNAVYAVETAADDIWGIGLRYRAANWRASIGYHDEAGTSVLGLGAQVRFGGFKVGFNAVDDDANPDTNFGLSFGSRLGASGDVVVNAKRRNDETHYQLYYRHKMSKRTNWYVGYGDEDSLGSEFRAGIRHLF